MRLFWPLLAGCAGLLTGAVATAAIPPQLKLLIKRSRVTQAHDMLVPLLEASPDDPELHAVYGSLMTQTGLHADAVTAFQFADGAQWYATSGMRQHALSLRAMGRIDEAIAVRRLSQMSPRRDETSDIVTALELLEDYREGRRWDEGQAVLDELLGMAPDGPKAWAAAVWFYTDQGKYEEAEWAAWNAARHGDSFESQLARANLALQLGYLDEAAELLKKPQRRRARHIVLGSLVAEVQRLQGNPDSAVHITRLRRYNDTLHIDLRASEVRALLDLEEYEAARAVLQLIRPHYERAPKFSDLEALVDAAEAGAGAR